MPREGPAVLLVDTKIPAGPPVASFSASFGMPSAPRGGRAGPAVECIPLRPPVLPAGERRASPHAGSPGLSFRHDLASTAPSSDVNGQDGSRLAALFLTTV